MNRERKELSDVRKKMQEKRFQKIYFCEDKEEPDLYFLVDCYEKVLYIALHEYLKDCRLIFCNDINLQSGIDTIGFYPKDLGLKDKIFEVTRYYPEKQDAIYQLENFIDSGIVVAVCTMFDKLPSCVWYQQEDKIGISNTHFITVIGYDKECFYFVDDPSMLSSTAKRLAENSTVAVLEKKFFKEAFEEYCEILTVKVHKEKIGKEDNLVVIKDKIIQNYYNEKIEEIEGKKFISGRRALIEFTHLLDKEEVLDTIVSNFYWIYLMAERRVLLRICLEKNAVLFEDVDRVCSLLKACEEEWMKLYFRVRAYFCGSGTREKTRKSMKERIQKIITVEDSLIKALEELKNI